MNQIIFFSKIKVNAATERRRQVTVKQNEDDFIKLFRQKSRAGKSSHKFGNRLFNPRILQIKYLPESNFKI